MDNYLDMYVGPLPIAQRPNLHSPHSVDLFTLSKEFPLRPRKLEGPNKARLIHPGRITTWSQLQVSVIRVGKCPLSLNDMIAEWKSQTKVPLLRSGMA